MNQNRKDKPSDPNRASKMEQAEGSRESMRGSGSSSESPSRDRGTSSDRAMFSDRESAEPRGSSSSSERGLGSSNERGMGSSRRSGSRDSGGISNREFSREQSEQDDLPDRGDRQSER